LDGTWYVYFTAGKGGKDLGSQRSQVIQGRVSSVGESSNYSGGKSPWDSYKYHGRLINEWSIDGTVFTINRKRYFFFSCQRNKLQSICGAELLSPNRIGGIHVITSPTQSWERKGQFPVNEAPEHIAHGGKNYLIYSASQCASQWYALGQLALKGTNPLDAKAWVKSGPLMTSANGNYGPGHNGLVAAGISQS
jgi:GH43 family beta-xylosidase